MFFLPRNHLERQDTAHPLGFNENSRRPGPGTAWRSPNNDAPASLVRLDRRHKRPACPHPPLFGHSRKVEGFVGNAPRENQRWRSTTSRSGSSAAKLRSSPLNTNGKASKFRSRQASADRTAFEGGQLQKCPIHFSWAGPIGQHPLWE